MIAQLQYEHFEGKQTHLNLCAVTIRHHTLFIWQQQIIILFHNATVHNNTF